MKKILSKEALAKEAAFWSKMSQAVNDHPGRLCHK
jgi:hypothetical protein